MQFRKALISAIFSGAILGLASGEVEDQRTLRTNNKAAKNSRRGQETFSYDESLPDPSRDDMPMPMQAEEGSGNVCDRSMQPQIPGVLPGKDRPRLILAQDIDYPPYAYLGPATEDSPITGFGPDFAVGMTSVCDIDVELVQTQWSNCWDSDRIGRGLALGEFHACTTYTHASGVRNRYLEFSKPILNDIKTAGVITRLDEDGNPIISGDSDLSGVRVVDVANFAPTEDNLAIVTNRCTGNAFSGYEIVPPSYDTDFPIDDALKTLLDGDADAVWIYADQADQYLCANNEQPTSWDCAMWDGLGTDFAYIHFGMPEWQRAGTTMTIAKKGAGLAENIDPCIDMFLETESYYDLCVKYDVVDTCFKNEFFPDAAAGEIPLYDYPTNELPDGVGCSDGYCPCPAR